MFVVKYNSAEEKKIVLIATNSNSALYEKKCNVHYIEVLRMFERRGLINGADAESFNLRAAFFLF